MLFAVTGCGDKWEMGYVSGQVTYKGKSLPEGAVMFVPQTGLSAVGGIHPDGTYQLFTRKPWDGAVVGKHKVCVLPPYAPYVSNYPQFSLKYQNQETSEWEVEVKPGQNTFDFNIPE